jgi:ABC-type bacteriocin/lantibiotic exporter with double-glycine peptidase domain
VLIGLSRRAGLRQYQARLITDLLAVTRGKTVILVTHHPGLIGRARHIAALEAGRLTLSPSQLPVSVAG